MARAYGFHDGFAVSVLTSSRITDPSRTDQSQKEESDINTIVRQFMKTQQLPYAGKLPQYGDFTEVEDYRSAIHAVRNAEASFLALPSALRERFRNDPQLFLEFATDPRNLDELRELGLANPKPAPVQA